MRTPSLVPFLSACLAWYHKTGEVTAHSPCPREMCISLRQLSSLSHQRSHGF
ncbi:hypothetical protein RHSIM_Rhsim06G0226400 [Rhododendron simsii]|uniref:Uncharacterized protein n=1 Tax=Rhododendron simsii TaxID=118357 RepID=A0A834GWH2_RHOSS|nr:hypothetical protein RHSIM_Rhsim06G0226400 [Rhododendron simsii]